MLKFSKTGPGTDWQTQKQNSHPSSPTKCRLIASCFFLVPSVAKDATPKGKKRYNNSEEKDKTNSNLE